MLLSLACLGAIQLILGVVGRAEKGKDKTRNSLHWQRRLQHASSLVFLAELPSWVLFVIATCLFSCAWLRRVSVSFNSIFVRSLDGILREHEKRKPVAPSAAYSVLAAAVLRTLSLHNDVCVALLHAALADPLAAIVGSSLQSQKLRWPLCARKSVAGLLACVAVCTAVNAACFVWLPVQTGSFVDAVRGLSSTWRVSIGLLGAGVLCGLTEALDIFVLFDDNLLLPLLSALILRVLAFVLN
ncbi:MAG: hypothetical protein MHM6MM_000288 [Cercozoa sp. M6MM]